MNLHVRIVLAVLVVGAVLIGIVRFVVPILSDSQQRETSDARGTKGRMVIGVDNWIGYFPLCSGEMRKRMRRSGYVLVCEDDQANYPERMRRLRKGDIQLAVATVDSYVLNGAAERYPGAVVAVIDESKGGDAMLAWGDRVDSLDALKQASSNLKVAFTPQSPSEHLLKSIAVHFDIPVLRQRHGDWRVESDGSEAALKALLDKQVDVAVLWEPDVNRALETKGIVKLMGSEDTRRLIVDILIVNREYSQDNPDAVKTLLVQYFRTLKYYRDNDDKLVSEVADSTDVSEKQAEAMLEGVSWTGLTDNALFWYGLGGFGSGSEEGLVDTIEGVVEVLVDNGDLKRNPIPDEDPYRLTNSSFIELLYQKGSSFAEKAGTSGPGDQAPAFSALSAKQWQKLREVGTLKIRPILYQSGTSDLTYEGKTELDRAVKYLEHYPNFRVVVKGHTGLRGDKAQNRILSQERADAVKRYLDVTHDIQPNRLRSIGSGSDKPLPRLPGESNRAYGYRLPRVELVLVADDY